MKYFVSYVFSTASSIQYFDNDMIETVNPISSNREIRSIEEHLMDTKGLVRVKIVNIVPLP